MLDFITTDQLATADFQQGTLLLVDKPPGWTSFDVVNKIRGTLKYTLQVKKIKVGHAGTLDPIATGLLLICTGRYTPRLAELQGLDKTYSGELTLGAVTASYDSESEPESHQPWEHLTRDVIEEALTQFVGEIEQVPPIFSAIKKDGQPLYKIARKGGDVTPEPRPVRILSAKITGIDLPKVTFSVTCSKGTYIRSLVHDLGQKLGCGAYLTALRRENIGEYTVRDAWSVDALVDAIKTRG